MNNETNKFIYIANIQPGMKNVNVNFIVLEIGAIRRTAQGQDVRTVKVADPTGSINFGAWGDELGEFLKPGDIYRLRNGFVGVHRGSMTLSCGKMGELLKTNEFFMAYVETPNMSEYSAELDAKYPYVNKKASPDQDSRNVESFSSSSSSSSLTKRPIGQNKRPAP